MNAEVYVNQMLGGCNVGEVGVMVYHSDEKLKGFFTYWPSDDYYTIFVSYKKADKIGKLTKLALRHEVGHVFFHWMYLHDQDRLFGIMDDIKKKHPIFRKLQRIWYWSKPLRAIRRALGFSSRISYNPDEKYDQNLNGAFSRADNELFCDWFAWYGYKEWKGC